MTTLFLFGLMLLGALLSLIIVPLILLKVVLVMALSLIVIPFKIAASLLGGLLRGAFKGMIWLALLAIPLAILAFPLTIMVFGAWLLYRAVHPKRSSQAYVVA